MSKTRVSLATNLCVGADAGGNSRVPRKLGVAAQVRKLQATECGSEKGEGERAELVPKPAEGVHDAAQGSGSIN